MLDILAGKRTYILSIGAVLAAVGGFMTGEFTLAEAIQNAVLGAGLGTLRAAVR
jgi:hypothetical protein